MYDYLRTRLAKSWSIWNCCPGLHGQVTNCTCTGTWSRRVSLHNYSNAVSQTQTAVPEMRNAARHSELKSAVVDRSTIIIKSKTARILSVRELCVTNYPTFTNVSSIRLVTRYLECNARDNNNSKARLSQGFPFALPLASGDFCLTACYISAITSFISNILQIRVYRIAFYN